MLTPLVAATGIEDFRYMKVQQVAFLLLALVGMYACIRREVPGPYALTLVGLIGFNPAVWERKDTICSDLAFMMFFFAALWAIQRSSRKSITWSVIVGVLLYLCYGTRDCRRGARRRILRI
jgi:hypothetical protein